jgi:penicillin amidase
LFPLAYNYPESIISQDHKWTSQNHLPPAPENEFQAALQNQKLKVEPHPGNGSNNWAVFGEKSSTHMPILSNDIHLDYSLPALWYQMQLVSPTQNVYGVSLVGAPGIVIGFSKELAWGVTNASGDFMDWYEMKFKDESKTSYLFDGEWRPVREHDYTIKVRGAQSLTLKLKDTHFGPIVFDNETHDGIKNIPKGLALRWTALDPSNELKSFLQLNRARSLSDCQSALEGFQSPAQNFICADNTGQVEMIERGKFPLRFMGQGQLVSDGSDSRYQWTKDIPREETAFEINPKRNFVFSANQQPVSGTYPLYLGVYYEPPFRAQRIHQILKEKAVFTPEDIVHMQSDTLNKLGEKMVPFLIGAMGNSTKSSSEEQAFEKLKSWDFHNDLESIGATVFDHLWSHLEKNIWSHHFPDDVNYRYPNSFITSEIMIHDPKSKWLNPLGESFEQILTKSFAQAVDEISSLHGSNPKNWKWKYESRAVLNHITKIPLFSTDIESPGNRFNIMANRTNHGPVWKMVVSLGEHFSAWGIYPGGQSGDIRSPHSREFLKDWANSHLRPIRYLSGEDLKKSSTHVFEPLKGQK